MRAAAARPALRLTRERGADGVLEVVDEREVGEEREEILPSVEGGQES